MLYVGKIWFGGVNIGEWANPNQLEGRYYIGG